MLITVNVDLTSEAAQTQLLEGLDNWLRLGLLSDAQVKQLCETYLMHPLPPIPVVAPSPTNGGYWITEPNPPEPQSAEASPTATAVRQPPTFVARMLQSFVAEISVMWLLFLGVFMVVVSSGVLAATQWRNFPPAGQYGILLAYTIAFWGASLWTGRQPQLQLTTRMLAIATLLLIPVNFWMMDGLRVWQSGVGVGLVAIAALLLTALTLVVLRTPVGLPLAVNPRLTAINAVALGWLHWGWSWGGWPLIATYIGTVGTAFCLSYQLQQRDRPLTDDPDQPPTPFPELFSLGTLAIAFATLLLIGRAIFGAQVPLSRLGLALGICGWLLCWLSRPTAHWALWHRVGAGLLLGGWAVSVLVQPPWQAIAVSALGLWLLWDRLKATWRLAELSALLGVGLQAFWLMWFMLPNPWRQEIIGIASHLVGYPVDGAYLGSVGGFPYVVLMLGMAVWLRRQQQSQLARDTERMALALGILLAFLGLSVDGVRSLNLTLSVITLVAVVRRRQSPGRFLIYLTHVTGLAALLSWIDGLQPALDSLTWVKLLLAIVVVEWALSVGDRHRRWRQSAWHLGLLLAALAYPILFAAPSEGNWRLLWCLVPIGLTGLGSRRHFSQPRLANWLTVPALVLQLLLMDSLNSLLITLGIATVLMLINTKRLQQLVTAGLSVGFALFFVGTAVWRGFSEHLTVMIGLNLLAIALWSLWLVRAGLSRRDGRLARLYALATDGWAIALTLPLLLIFTGYSLSFYAFPYAFPIVATWSYLGAVALATLAIAYRLWQQPSNLGFCALAWGLEVFAAGAIALANPDAQWMAIATLTLGLLAQLAGDIWVHRTTQPYRSSWHAIPLAYGVLGWVLGHQDFTTSSGLYTLATALIWIGVGRRQLSLRPLTYLSLLAISVGAYELLVCKLLQSSGGEPGDGITLLAGLALLLAFTYRLLAPWLLPYLRLSKNNLYAIADPYWALGTALAILAFVTPRSTTGDNLLVAVMTLLATYALITANHRLTPISPDSPTPSPSDLASPFWLYSGILEAIATLTYILHRVLPDDVLPLWGGAIACGLAIPMYYLPWDAWGWPLRPWRRSACILPGVAVVLTSGSIALQTLLITGSFYAWLAKATRHLRLSYFSVVLLDWAILRYLTTQGWLEPVWISAILGCSLLYIVQIDPSLRDASDRDKRHLLKVLATGLICLTALYQAEVEPEPIAIWFAVLTLVLSIGLILSGLVLRTRSFLYVGTVTFIVRVLRLLWLFISTYSLFLWAIGIVIGLLFIWIAATFEARRSQVNAFVQYWAAELEEWE